MTEAINRTPYVPFNWQDHAVERPRTYSVTKNPDDSVTLTPNEGEVYQQGTPMSAERFNHMERGIAACDAREANAEICVVDIRGISDDPYPLMSLLFSGYGYGMGGLGDTPYGGTALTTIAAAFSHDDGLVHVYVPARYAAYTNVARIGTRMFVLTTGKQGDDTSLALVIH